MPTKTKPAASTAPAAAPMPKPPGKSALVLKLLARAKGATIAEVAEPTAWQPHSTRAYLSGLRKRGQTVIREQRKTGETAYRIVDAASSTPGVAATGSDKAFPTSADSTQTDDSVGDASRTSAGTGDAAQAGTAAATPASA